MRPNLAIKKWRAAARTNLPCPCLQLGLSTARRMSRWARAGRSRHVRGGRRRLRPDGRGRRPDGKGQGGQAGTMSHEESRTYTLAVVVEPAEGVWHAYCPTLDRLQLRELGRRQLGPVARDADDNAAEDFHPPDAVPPARL